MTRSATPTRRQRITQGLASVIAETGYRDSKIQDVAAHAHVSLTTIYNDFGSKEAILLELHDDVVRTLIDVIGDAVVFDREWKRVIHAAFERYFKLLALQPRLTYAIVIELATLSEDARRSREHAMQQLGDHLCRLVEAGRIAYPEVPSRALSPLMARAILGAVNELVLSCVVGATEWNLPALADAATDLLWGVVTA